MKKLKKAAVLFILVVMTVTLTGCLKINYKTEITKDGSMDFELLYMLSDEIAGMAGDMDLSEYSGLEEKGYTVEACEEDDYTGIRISRRFDIDEISSDDETEVDLTALLNGEIDDSAFYKKSSAGLLKNRYEAHFLIDTSDTESDESFDMSDYADKIEFTFTAVFPKGETVSSNADTISDDGLTHTWNLTYGEAAEIEYSFTLNKDLSWLKWVIAGAAVLFLAAVIVVIIVCVKMDKKNRKQISVPVDMSVSDLIGEAKTGPSSEEVSAARENETAQAEEIPDTAGEENETGEKKETAETDPEMTETEE